MEFLKHKWGYLLAIVMIAAVVTLGIAWARWKNHGDTYTDGLLVMNEAVQENRPDACPW